MRTEKGILGVYAYRCGVYAYRCGVYLSDTPQAKKKSSVVKKLIKLLEIEKKIVREVVRGDKHNRRNSANRNTQISDIHSAYCTDLCFAIFRFSQVVFVTSNHFTHNLLFYFQ